MVLFHACCHNPCGVSPSPEQWEAITDLAAERGFTPMIDMAYMGFERGIEEDALSVRLFAEKCPEVMVASSCSKNFAVYRERVGAISVVCETAEKAADVMTVINSLTRKNYSMPPTHGTGIIDIILHSDELTALWREEVTGMRNRINGLRKLLSDKNHRSRHREGFLLPAAPVRHVFLPRPLSRPGQAPARRVLDLHGRFGPGKRRLVQRQQHRLLHQAPLKTVL